MGSKRMGERMFYCVKCKARVTIKADDICFKKVKTSIRTVNMLKGYHSKCGVACHKIISDDSAPKMMKKYGKCSRGY